MSKRENMRTILGFLAPHYPASYTAWDIAQRCNLPVKNVRPYLVDLLDAGLVSATTDRITHITTWNCTPRGRKELSLYEPVKRSRRKFFGRRKSIYIAGPMSGLPDNNFSKFFDAEARRGGGKRRIQPQRTQRTQRIWRKRK